MPERRDDNNAYWTYKTTYPGADFKQNQIGVQHPQLVEATGTDGRFIGAIRPFPGMADSTIHGVPKPEAGQTITSISNVVYAKYVSIQKAATRHTLKGIAYIADNQLSTGSAIYFAYRDSQDNSDDVVMLEDFKVWTDYTLDSLTNYDITSNGKYIYFVCSGDTSSTPLSKWDEMEPPYNKAYFFDWKINSWDAFNRNSTGFESRFMGLFPVRLLEGVFNTDSAPEHARGNAGSTTDGNTTINLSGDTPNLSTVSSGDFITISGVTSGMQWTEKLEINAVDNGADTVGVTVAPQSTATGVIWFIKDAVSEDSEDSLDFSVAGTAVAETFKMPKGNYTGAVELVSRKHNLRSHIRFRTRFATEGNDSSLRWRIDNIHLPNQVDGASGQINQLRSDAAATSCTLHWGIPHVDGYRFWRSQGDGATAAGNRDKYSLVNPLYLVDNYKEKGVYQPTSAGLSQFWEHVPVFAELGTGAGNTTYFDDLGLVTQLKYDAFDETFGVMPRAKLIVAYAGILVGITDIAEPSTLEGDWEQADQRTEELFWSHTGKLEPENFPPENRYPPDDPSEKFLALEVAGDHCFAISTSSVYKLSRSGAPMAMNRILSRLGGVSRSAATGVGNILFLVTEAGVKSIDGNTGAVKSISAMDRIIMDDSEWAKSLADVHLEYDATVGALVFLNTTKSECFILWEATGAITRLTDCPWVFMAGGNDALSNGSQRAYFILSDGTVHCIDGAREMGKRSMCGTGASETVNGKVTSASATQIIDSGATFPVNCVNHKVYIHNGPMEGDVLTITARNSATTLTVTGLSESTSVTSGSETRYSVAPVVTELVFQQLDGAGGVDPFSRKVATAMSAAFSDLAGESGTDDVNAFIRMGIWRNRIRLTEVETRMNLVPDQVVARVHAADVRVYPSLRFLGGNLDFELQALLVHGLLTASEAQTRQS